MASSSETVQVVDDETKVDQEAEFNDPTAKEATQKDEDVFEQAAAIIEQDRSSVLYFDYVAREKHQTFISALPDKLQIKREDWKKQKSFETQTLLIRGHRSFRQRTQQMVKSMLSAVESNRQEKANHLKQAESNQANSKQENSKQAKSKQATREIVKNVHYVLRSFFGSLHSHSSYEENKLFKFLEIKYDVDLSLLLEDHHLIDEMEGTCKTALKDILSCKLDAIPDEMLLHALQALVSFDRSFTRHLGEEEEIVIPMLLTLSYPDYLRYYNARTYKQALGL